MERSNNGYNNQDSHQEFSVTTSNNNPTSPPTSVGSNPNSGSNNNSTTTTSSSRLYSKYNNNLVPPTNENGVYNAGIRNNKQQHMDEHQRMKQYFNEYKQVNELTHMMLSNYNGNGNGSGSGSFSGGSGGDRGGVGAYEDDFPELTTTKFSQLRLNTSGDRLSPPVNNVPSNNTSDFCF